MSPLLPVVRRAATMNFSLPIASQSVCRQCLRRQSPTSLAPAASSVIMRLVRQASTTQSPLRKWPVNTARPMSTATATASTPLNATTHSSAAGQADAKKRSVFPETSSKSVAYWLIGSAVSVFGIVVFGGLTRLTESGLSITEWKPMTGSMPPLSQRDWESEFEKYRASPEFKMLNSHMDLDEFKQIYFMEWTHRLWGRFIGMSFVLPALYFVARRRISAPMARSVAGISCLIGFQGFIGWWMVKSGLKDDLFEPGSHPRVSQYRLAAHLSTAFVCYAWMLLAGLSVLRTHRLNALSPAAASQHLSRLQNPALVPLRRLTTGLTGLIGLTVFSGALVAGLDAGLIYNEFPKMGLGLTPPRSELFDRFYCRDPEGSDLWWRNVLENPSLVQLDHRILATTTFCSVLALFIYARRGRVSPHLTPELRKGVTGLVHLVSLQVALGISTLIYMVPIPLAAAHQAGSLALLTGALVLGHRLRVPKSTLAIVQRRVQAAAATAQKKL